MISSHGPIRYQPSTRARKELTLRRFAEQALARKGGALVGCGNLTLLDVNWMSNLALSWYMPIAFSSARADLLEEAVVEHVLKHRERGYWCKVDDLESLLEELPAEPYPATIAFLYLKSPDVEDLKTCFTTLVPLIMPGAAIVFDQTQSLVEALDPARVAMGFETVETDHEDLVCWVRPVDQESEPESVEEEETGSEAFTVLTYPGRPGGKFSYLCAAGHFRLENDPRKPFDLAMKWNPQTYTLADSVLDELSRLAPVINLGCDDISKRRVEEEHIKVYGYGLIVDARSYHGTCVQKANLNAQNREYVVECPQADADQTQFVYQRLVTTPTEPDEYEEYRVAITGDEIPIVVIKRRPVTERFNRSAGYAILAEADSVFSGQEQDKIFEMCRAFRLQFGDLDILRDRDDGRLFVIDINPTPGGPGGGYTEEQRRQLVEIQLASFRRQFVEGAARVRTHRAEQPHERDGA